MHTITIADKAELAEILKSCSTCFVAFVDQDAPYVVPMNFGYDGEYVYLHSGKAGRKWEAVTANPRVCISWMLGDDIVAQDERVGCSYRVASKTVMLEGNLELVDDYEEKLHCLHMLMGQYSEREFQFNRPAVENVGIMRIAAQNLVGKHFGVKPKR
ncbi:MAG: pyridoxamine 5'-phosphate oxidase family protein [Mangrovibacterium sp.]